MSAAIRPIGRGELQNIGGAKGASPRMPVLFVGHGNPMNAIENNAFTRTWRAVGTQIPRPRAILSISAHWLTPGSTRVTTTDTPETIHDFWGFPQALYEERYPAPGAPDTAEETRRLIKAPEVLADSTRGLDHGTWSVLGPMFPLADIPVFQLSIDYDQPPAFHFELGRQIMALRDRGVLIIGSGNIVHNLGAMRMGEAPYDWAIEFDGLIGRWLEQGNVHAIVEFQELGNLAAMAQPTHDHYLPLLYVVGARHERDSLEFFNTAIDLSSVSMRSVLYT